MTLHHLKPRQDGAEPELGAIVGHMWENGEKLARQEIALGLAELQVRADKLKTSLLDGAIVGGIYNAAILVLLASAVLGLSKVLEPWLAALIVGVAAIALGYAVQTSLGEKAKQAAQPKLKEGNR